jgi:hypothetical protein
MLAAQHRDTQTPAAARRQGRPRPRNGSDRNVAARKIAGSRNCTRLTSANRREWPTTRKLAKQWPDIPASGHVRDPYNDFAGSLPIVAVHLTPSLTSEGGRYVPPGFAG